MLLASLLFLAASPLDAHFDVPELTGASVSFAIYSMSGEPLVEHNSNQLLVPASNQKLLTAAFALDTLGLDYQPETIFWKESHRLIIQSEGDPTLSYDDLKEIRAKIGGHDRSKPVYLSQAYSVGVPRSWEYDDLPNRYAAGVAALSFDHSGFELWVKDGKLTFVPETFGVQVRQRSTSGAFKFEYNPITRTLITEGAVPSGTRLIDTLALPNPDLAAASMFGSQIFRTQFVPTSSPTYVHKGKPLREALEPCLIKSNNNMAENLLLMAALKHAPLGDDPYETASQAITEFLTTEVGIPEEHVRVYDGSGLSRHNFVTTSALAKLLVWADAKYSTDWESLLVCPGSGTLKSRLSGSNFSGKTGTLDAVVALSGYVTLQNGDRVVVSILINNFKSQTREVRALCDSFIRKIEGFDTIGTLLASELDNEDNLSDKGYSNVNGHRLRRLNHDRGVTRQWFDCRDESSHAFLY